MVFIRLESINSLKCTVFLFLHRCAKNFCTGKKIFLHTCAKKFFAQVCKKMKYQFFCTPVQKIFCTNIKKVFCTGAQKIKYFIFEFHINLSKSKYFNLAFDKNLRQKKYNFFKFRRIIRKIKYKLLICLCFICSF